MNGWFWSKLVKILYFFIAFSGSLVRCMDQSYLATFVKKKTVCVSIVSATNLICCLKRNNKNSFYRMIDSATAHNKMSQEVMDKWSFVNLCLGSLGHALSSANLEIYWFSRYIFVPVCVCVCMCVREYILSGLVSLRTLTLWPSAQWPGSYSNNNEQLFCSVAANQMRFTRTRHSRGQGWLASSLPVTH